MPYYQYILRYDMRKEWTKDSMISPWFLCTWNFVISAGVVDVEAVVEGLRRDLPPGPGQFAYCMDQS